MLPCWRAGGGGQRTVGIYIVLSVEHDARRLAAAVCVPVYIVPPSSVHLRPHCIFPSRFSRLAQPTYVEPADALYQWQVAQRPRRASPDALLVVQYAPCQGRGGPSKRSVCLRGGTASLPRGSRQVRLLRRLVFNKCWKSVAPSPSQSRAGFSPDGRPPPCSWNICT